MIRVELNEDEVVVAPTPAQVGEQAKQEALQMVATGNEAWLDKAISQIELVAKEKLEFTTDDVWAAITKAGLGLPGEMRAMGMAIVRAKNDGVMRDTGRYIKSNRPVCHRRPIPVYRSACFP
jgi:tRNA(Arg) A34 adenosine deaminase TadA